MVLSKVGFTDMLTHLKLNNFKIWRTTGQMQLAPLTLVFGTNSSGKSSLIQSLLLLRQTVKSQDSNLDLNFGNPDSSDSVVLGQFVDVLCRHGAATEAVKAKQIGIEFGWRAGEPGTGAGTFTARYVQGRGGSADLAYLRIGSAEELESGIDSLLAAEGPLICEVMCPRWQLLVPRVASKQLEDGTMMSMPYDDMFPFLDRDEYEENLVID